MDLSPNHANTLYNYAVLLDTHLKRKPEAEKYYRLTIEVEARHAYALYNLAVLLEEKYFGGQSTSSQDINNQDQIHSNIKETSAFYRRAAEADPRDSTALADYGR